MLVNVSRLTYSAAVLAAKWLPSVRPEVNLQNPLCAGNTTQDRYNQESKAGIPVKTRPPKNFLKNYFYRPQRSCGQGYVFTCVCDSVHGGVSGQGDPPHRTRENPPRSRETPRTRQTPPRPGRHPPDQGELPRTRENPLNQEEPPPGPGRTLPDQGEPPTPTPSPGSRLQNTVYERPVRILLECILV